MCGKREKICFCTKIHMLSRGFVGRNTQQAFPREGQRLQGFHLKENPGCVPVCQVEPCTSESLMIILKLVYLVWRIQPWWLSGIMNRKFKQLVLVLTVYRIPLKYGVLIVQISKDIFFKVGYFYCLIIVARGHFKDMT